MTRFKKSGSNLIAVNGDDTKYVLICPSGDELERYTLTFAFGVDPKDMGSEGFRADAFGRYTLRSAKKVAACFLDGGTLG